MSTTDRTTGTQPAAVSDPETFVVTRTVHVAAPPDRVWLALTREEHIARWFGQSASLPEVRPGATGTFGFDGYGEFPVRIDEVDEPRVLAWTWSGNPGGPEELRPGASTHVRFTLEPDGDGTRLSVVESGFGDLTTRDPLSSLESNREGWTSELDELVVYVESTMVSA